MAQISKILTVVDVQVRFTINEDELRALDALVGYGIDSFLKAFYASLGRSYLEPHEAGLRSLFESVRGCKHLANEARECREFLQGSYRSLLAKEKS